MMGARPRHGGVLGGLLVILVVVSLSGALAWTILANHHANGAWSFHPLDPAWWSPTAKDPAASDPFADVTQDAKHLAGQAGEALWGKGGLVERCETWWQQRNQPAGTSTPITGAPATNTPTQPPHQSPTPAPAPTPTTIRGMLEQRFTANERHFAEGIDLAKHARPTLNDDTITLAGRMATLTQARTCFGEVERDLGEAIPAYAAIPGHDPAKLANAQQLLGFTRQMQELTRLTP
ncbi:MAG TPA: hypothetical protein VHX44_20380 [Planctomycetota bacterium]|nr:hypothetical protein [Planctomycetota bacterium]